MEEQVSHRKNVFVFVCVLLAALPTVFVSVYCNSYRVISSSVLLARWGRGRVMGARRRKAPRSLGR